MAVAAVVIVDDVATMVSRPLNELEGSHGDRCSIYHPQDR